MLDVSLKKAGFEVATASSGGDALRSLEAELPDLIISDTDLEEMDGFELCNRIKAKPEWAKIPFLFVSGRKSIEDKIRGLELGVDDYLTKPIYIREIGIRVRTALQRAERERMESRREGRTRFAGDLSDVGVVDLVQTIELNRKSGIVHVVNRDDRRGSIFFRDGKVIDAEVGRLSGAHAIYRLFSWSEGQFAVEFKQIRRHDVIDMSMAGLLMEGMRRLDEGARLLESLPPPSNVLEVDCRVLAEELAELPDEMNAVLRLCDGARTFQEVVEESDLPDLETLGIIKKLSEGQVIFARETPERGGASSPGIRLANWLSEGGAEGPAAAHEPNVPSQLNLAGEAGPSSDALPSLGEIPPVRDLDLLSAEETLGAMLPSRADATDDAGGELGRAADTLKGIYVENLFGSDDEKPEGQARTEPAAERSEDGGAEEPRPTKPLGLAERLLSGDSVLRTAAMHEAISDSDGSVKEPLAGDRHTQPYGDAAAEAAAALVQEVVSSTHGKVSHPTPLAEPERPSKEVDWGAWPAILPSAAAFAVQAPPKEVETATQAAPVAKPEDELQERPEENPGKKTQDSKTSAAELETSDLQELEPGDVPPVEPKPPARPADVAPARDEPAEEATRLGAEDVLPIEPGAEVSSPGDEAAIPEPIGAEPGETDSEPRSGHDRAQVSASTAAPRTSRKPSQARQIWLMGIAAFALGMVGFLALGRKAAQPDEPSPTAALPPGAASARAAAPAVAVAVPAVPSVPSKTVPTPGKPSAAKPGVASAPGAAQVEKPARLVLLAATPPPSAPELRRKCLEVDAEGKGKARAVSAACRPALEADAKDAEVMVILARAEIDRGHLVEARSLAKKALAVDPQRLEAYVYLGTAEQEAGKLDEARAAYKKYLELAPDGPFARELRAILGNL